MKKIKIFLASSKELLADREKFQNEIRKKNDRWEAKNISFELHIWENLSAKMSSTRSQDEYNEKIREADLFVLLIHTKVGIYSEEEFDKALESFKTHGKPELIVYFNEASFKPDSRENIISLFDFKDRLKELEYFPANYNNPDHLWNQFNKELDGLLLPDLELKDTTVQDETKKIVDYETGGIPKALGGIPVNPSVYIGRENSTKEIHERLKSNDHLLLLINGKGGIGKTTMASQYYFEYNTYYKHLIWLVSEKGIKDAIISLALPLKISFANNLTQEQQIDQIIIRISELKKPVLLIIDNANNIKDLNESYQILRKFSNTNILITSRIDSHPSIDNYKVNHLDEKAANQLFKRYYKAFKSEEQALLDEVLIAIGYNTLVIELLAKNLNEFNTGLKDHYPLQKLLEDIQEKGVLAISKSAEIHADYKLKATKPEDIIRSMYDISPLSEAEKQILSIFAVLPATSIPFVHLEQFLPKIKELDRVALKLSQKGWIDYDKALQSFKTNPIISEIAREQNKERLVEHTELLVSFLLDILDYEVNVGHIPGDFNEIKTMVAYAETFVNNFEILTHYNSDLLEKLGNFYSTYGNLGKALQFFERYSKLVKELNKSNPTDEYVKNDLLISYAKLGNTHTMLGSLDTALLFFKSYLKVAKELYKSNTINTTFKNNLAISYSKLGDTHTALGNLDTALQFFEDFMKLMRELYESDPKNINFKDGLAISYERLGNTHAVLGNLDKALEFFEEYSKLMKELYESHPTNVGFKNGLSISYEKIGSIHFRFKNLDKALQFFNEQLKLEKELNESYPTNIYIKNGLAISYSKLGDIHTDLGNLDKALSFFEDYLKLRKELYESNPTNVDFKYGLAVSYQRLGSIHVVLGNLEKALHFFEDGLKLTKELYESYPTHVDFKDGLAVSNLKLGKLYIDQLYKKQEGIVYLKKGLVLYEELITNFPKYADFQNNYNWVLNKIKSVEES